MQDVARKAIDSIEENDPTALKATYRLLFERINIGGIKSDGSREVNFVLRSFDVSEDANLVRFIKDLVPRRSGISKRNS